MNPQELTADEKNEIKEVKNILDKELPPPLRVCIIKY